MGFFSQKESSCKIVPRDYQSENTEECFRVWDGGQSGALTRAFTGSGKTPMACLIISKWLRRGPDYRAMVISYETQLVWQFAQEIEDFLGITPGIEMERDAVKSDLIPKVVVACRASLLRSKLPDQPLKDEIAMLGITEVGSCDSRACQKILRELRKGTDVDILQEQIKEFNARPEVVNGVVSRVHKFDWRLNWLTIWDEAHRHAHSLASVGHIADWFDQNPKSKRHGLTATPKRSDNISIGSRMFPGIALDYPLFSLNKRCGVKDGWAVPYIQKYIEVEGVDFKSIRKLRGDFDPDELERILGSEGTLAKLIEPMLDMVGERRTLIFSPGIEMAKNVALYINARSPCVCKECGKRKWYPTLLIGDGAQCPCGAMIDPGWAVTTEPQARALWGSFAAIDRKKTYKDHQNGKFQFLSVCGLCREGYNDPDISCVAVFRPVSRKASSLADQMKGRACRPCRAILAILNQTQDADERCAIIANSSKPNALIIDLVGITGLADCASTIQIYCDGDTDVSEKAEELLLAKGKLCEADVEETIRQAQEFVEEEKERIRKEKEEQRRREQEEFDKRSKANAEVTYTVHDYGQGRNYDPKEATEKQYKFIEHLGMAIHNIVLSKKQAGKLINLLKLRKSVDAAAAECWLKDGQWSVKGPSVKQRQYMHSLHLDSSTVRSSYDASQLIDAKKDPNGFTEKKLGELDRARCDDDITAVARDIQLVRGILPQALFWKVVEAGKQKRSEGKGDSWEGDE